VSRFRIGVVALCAVVLVVAGWALLRTNSPQPPTPSVGVATCPLTNLPPEVTNTVRAIHSNGPFPFPRDDGAVFGNRERHLPDQKRGYYHEYTVITPGARDRSTRRIITGGSPLTNPVQYFYTENHYDSFCLVSDAGRQG
jgi:ribonuclease T1